MNNKEGREGTLTRQYRFGWMACLPDVYGLVRLYAMPQISYSRLHCHLNKNHKVTSDNLKLSEGRKINTIFACCFIILFCFILFCFILFYFILFYFILFYFILFYFILFYFILFSFLVFYFIYLYLCFIMCCLFSFLVVCGSRLFCFCWLCFFLTWFPYIAGSESISLRKVEEKIFLLGLLFDYFKC